MKTGRLILTAFVLTLIICFTVFGGTYSEYWKQDAAGNWYVQRPDGSRVTGAWLCDDAVAENGKDVWYLLDENGQMVTAGLVQDGTGNFYSIETEHNGYYGMLRYRSGTYDGVDLVLEKDHKGAFASILNQEGVSALNRLFGLTDVQNISNANCVYTSAFGGTGNAVGSSSSRSALEQGGKTGKGTPITSTSVTNGECDGTWYATMDLTGHCPAYQRLKLYIDAKNILHVRWVGAGEGNGNNNYGYGSKDGIHWHASDHYIQMDGNKERQEMTITFTDTSMFVAEIWDYENDYNDDLAARGIYHPGIRVIYTKDVNDTSDPRYG